MPMHIYYARTAVNLTNLKNTVVSIESKNSSNSNKSKKISVSAELNPWIFSVESKKQNKERVRLQIKKLRNNVYIFFEQLVKEIWEKVNKYD